MKINANGSSLTREAWLPILAAEQLALGLLGKLLFEFPAKDWFQSLAAEAIFDEIPFAAQQSDVQRGLEHLSQWSHENQNELTATSFEAITSDYTSLFIGPGEVLAPPWESVYFSDGRLTFQEQTLQVRTWFRRFGLESAKLKNEPDDHIGLEMALLAHIAGLAIVALEQKAEDEFWKLLEVQQRFLTEHPLRWMSQWCELVLAHARTDFYRGVALVTRGVLTELATILEVNLAEGLQS